MTYFLTQDKLYLYVPYSMKEEAKEKGAKYNAELLYNEAVSLGTTDDISVMVLQNDQ